MNAASRIASLCLLLAFGFSPREGKAAGPAPKTVEFNRDVRPVLSDNCYPCHGPDPKHREADLRLDVRDVAVSAKAIVPGSPDKSELVSRIFSKTPDERMPPPSSRKTLTAEQKEILKRWIAEGAVYQGHWSYSPPARPTVPAGANGVDYLVQKRLTEAGLKPSPEADRRTLIRRLYQDLAGLPPKPEQVDAFVADRDPQAYQRLVEQLLASPHYGERMAIGWLDVVRYADTIGYHSDNPRNVWPYRDYVIRAFNENKPFNEFTVEQLAGDLLPNSTQQQKVGSGFNRLLLSTEEGGAQPKDYEARMLTDRVRAVGTVWLGQTFGCCQCHDHKFDPITMRDFYSMGAFFADIQESILGRREDGMMLASPEQLAEVARLDAEIGKLQQQFAASTPELLAAQKAWEAEALSAKPAPGSPALPKEIVDLLKIEAAKRSETQKQRLSQHYRDIAPQLADLRKRLAEARKAKETLEAGIPRCLVSISGSPRTVRLLPRGDWMNESGPVMQPALPGFLPGPKIEGRRPTRLDLAQWIIARDNPLTARVFVNRLWKQFLGIGISRTLDDLGSQGEWPTSPQLLDWLACEFMESGWNVKHLVRIIVSSQTYRQSSVATAELLARDPENRLMARQGRFRMDAELVRDNALSISGLLVPKIGGPSVKPYQPPGYWENLNFPTREYVAEVGESQYRRGLYTWWQRSFLHPSLLAFDAPSREECAADRTRANIPQQALVLLNDPTYLEAARALAARILKEGGADVPSRLDWAWRQALGRKPREDEVAAARTVLEKHLTQYTQDPAAAQALLKVGLAPPPQGIAPAELAAWTSVARVLLNLHETITRS